MRADIAMAAAQISLPDGYAIRGYLPEDAAALAAVETRSSQLFADYGFPSLVPDPPTPPETLHRFVSRHESFVVTHDQHGPVGHAVLHPLDRYLHLRELAVDPGHGRRGLGSALVKLSIARSAGEMRDGVSLSTFRDLPFNERFYAAIGFVELPLDDAPPPLVRQFEAELPPGIPPQARLLMLYRN